MSLSGLGVVVLICLVYCYVVKVAGPRFMAHRPPFKLRGVMMAYNLIQILINATLFYKIAKFCLAGRFNFLCQKLDDSETEEMLQMVSEAWLAYLSRFLDFFDTIFFVLRKKDVHVSFLHVYHHATVPIIIWPVLRFVGNGNAILGGLMNTFIHVIMYLYYFLAALGPRFEKFIWWKKYLTSMQIIQFVVLLLHSLQHLLGSNPCNHPKMSSIWTILNGLIFLILFLNYYTRSYSKKIDKKEKNDKKQ